MKTENAVNPILDPLSDAQVASLEEYLSGSAADSEDGGKQLKDQINAALTEIDERVSSLSRTMLSPEEFRQLVAARQAVQAARLAMDLHRAGNESDTK